MSGAEIIGVVGSIIAIIDGATKVYGAATDASGLPEAFRNVTSRLPLARALLQTTQTELERSQPSEELRSVLTPILRGCHDKATRLQEMFDKVIPEEGAHKTERYRRAIKTIGKGSRVESLMKGILEDIQLLVSNRVMKLATDADIRDLTKEIEEASAWARETEEAKQNKEG